MTTGTWNCEKFTNTITGNAHALILVLEEGDDAGLKGSLRVISDRTDGRKIDTLVPLVVQTQGQVSAMMASGVNSPEGLLALLVKHYDGGLPPDSVPKLAGQLVWHSLSDGAIRSQAVEFHSQPLSSRSEPDVIP